MPLWYDVKSVSLIINSKSEWQNVRRTVYKMRFNKGIVHAEQKHQSRFLWVSYVCCIESYIEMILFVLRGY